MSNGKKKITDHVQMQLILLLLVLLVLPSSAWAKARPIATESGIVFYKGGDYTLKLDLARPIDGEGPFPAQLHDAKSAVRWLRANTGKYRIDPGHIGGVGWSSGGHIALLLGMTDPSDGLEGDGGDLEFSSRVQAVVNSAGATDLGSLYANTDAPGRIQALLGGTPAELPDLRRAASPLSYARRKNPPILTLQGDTDIPMPPIQSENFDAKMKEAGADHTQFIKKGVGHRDFNGDSAVWDFLDAHLKGGWTRSRAGIIGKSPAAS
jgi:acetyl esterase/lipase